MITTKSFEITGQVRGKRALTLSIMAVAALLMFSLAYTADAASLYRSLDIGATGNDVSSLQAFLATDANLYPSGLVTGYFGNLTQGGVQKFQVANGIVSSGTPATTGYGRVGPTTMAVINAKMNGGVTVGTDMVAPTISSLSINANNNSSTFNWNTNENASAIIYYSTSPISMLEGNAVQGVTISGSSLLAHADLRSAHTATISGLSSNTNYYYVVYVRDGSGNETIHFLRHL